MYEPVTRVPKFTTSFLDSLKPSAVRRQYREASGLLFFVEPGGAKVFYSIYKIAGRKRYLRHGAYSDKFGLSQARIAHEDAKQSAQKARRGEAVDPADAKRVQIAENLAVPTVKEFADVYIDRHARPNKVNWKEDRRVLDKDVLPVIGPLRMPDVRRPHIVAILDRKVDQGRPLQAGEVLKVVRKMMNFAVKRGVLETNPCTLVEAPAKYEPRERALKEDELHGFFKALAALPLLDSGKRALLLQLYTGVRPSEARLARLAEFDLQGKLWTVPKERRGKNDRAHVVPLAPAVVALVQEAIDAGDNSIFLFPGDLPEAPVSEQAIGRAITRNLELFAKHGVPKFTPHDLRRTFTTHIARLGHGLLKDRLLGHSPQTVADRHYDMYEYLKERRIALEVWADELARLRDGKQPTAKVLRMPRLGERP